MKEMFSREIKSVIKNATGNPLLTNCFFCYREVLSMIELKAVYIFYIKGNVFLVHRVGDLYKMYYFLGEADALKEEGIWEIRRELSVFTDLEAEFVARDHSHMPDVLEKLGFIFYKKYIRKQLVIRDQFIFEESRKVESANSADTDKIYNLLYETFDIMSDHLVSRAELRDFVREEQVLIVKSGKNVTGVLLFETHGKKSYLRALCVDSKFAGQGTGISLMANYIKRNMQSTKMFYLWVEDTNQVAKGLYEKLGYRDDGLKNYIYLYK